MESQKIKRARKINRDRLKEVERRSAKGSKAAKHLRLTLQYKESKVFRDEAQKHKSRFFQALEEDIFDDN